MTAQRDMIEAATPLWLPSKSIGGEKDSSKISLLSKETDFLKNLFFRNKEFLLSKKQLWFRSFKGTDKYSGPHSLKLKRISVQTLRHYNLLRNLFEIINSIAMH